MKHYELLFILKPTLTEEEVSAKVDFVKEILTKNGANIASVQSMGTRKLAYTVKNTSAELISSCISKLRHKLSQKSSVSSESPKISSNS